MSSSAAVRPSRFAGWGSGIFAGDWGAHRAAVYGVSEEDPGSLYARRALLKREVLPEHVASAVFRWMRAWPRRRPEAPLDILALYQEVLDGLRATGPVDAIGIDTWAVDAGGREARRYRRQPVDRTVVICRNANGFGKART
jgi:hypothetical protein